MYAFSTPAFAGGTVYIDDVLAVNATTGQTLWGNSKAGQGGNWPVPVVSQGTVYVSSFGTLYARDAGTGQQLWSVANMQPPAVADGVLYASGSSGTGNSAMNSLDAASGAVLWTTPTPGIGLFTPVVANGVVYASATNNHVYAFDALTGEQLWSAAVSGKSPVSYPSLPVVVNGMLYVASADRSIDAFGLPPGSAEAQAAESLPPPDPASLIPDQSLAEGSE